MIEYITKHHLLKKYFWIVINILLHVIVLRNFSIINVKELNYIWAKKFDILCSAYTVNY